MWKTALVVGNNRELEIGVLEKSKIKIYKEKIFIYLSFFQFLTAYYLMTLILDFLYLEY